MRVLQLGDEVIGVSREIERIWPVLEREALDRASLRGDAVPCTRFRTDTGVSGSLPVTPKLPIVFRDGEPHEVAWRGTILVADTGSKILGEPVT